MLKKMLKTFEKKKTKQKKNGKQFTRLDCEFLFLKNKYHIN